MSHKDQKPEKKARKSYTITKNCLILMLTPQPSKQWESDTDGALRSPLSKTGRDLFKDFQRENKHSFWNKPLAESMKEINFLGFFEPYTLFIKGSDKYLEVVREAYARRVLKPPRNFSIVQLGDVNGIEIFPVQQAQFIPLTEVLCLIISEMNKRKLLANQDTIRGKLGECYNKMPIPSAEVIHKSLTHLLNENKVEHSEQGYFIIGMEQLSPVDMPDDDTEYSCRIKKPAKERAYLMYKDGQLTKHILPTFMIDKGTQTFRGRGDINSAARPVSFPANSNINPNGMHTIYEREPTSVGQSPQATPDTASSFQRSLSMRERRSPAKNNFDRTSSMRVKMDIEHGYMTSDSEAKPSCFGKLLGKSPKKAALKGTDRNVNLNTFAAQFPPSDVHDPFFNYAHWQDKSPQKVAVNGNDKTRERIVEGSGNTAVVKEKLKREGPLPKDSKSRNTQQYKVDHGKLTQTAQSLQQKYKDAAQESMPESEAEFVRPTNMIDGKFRTKAVAEQAKPMKKKVLSIHSDKIKHYFSTLRESKPQQVKPFQGIQDCDTDSQITEPMSDLPPGMDLPRVLSKYPTAGNGEEDDKLGQYCALPSESENESIGVPSMVRKFVATSRHINETFSARKRTNPAAKQVENPNNAAGVRERPQGLSPSQPYPEQNGLQNGVATKQNGSLSAAMSCGSGNYYPAGEIDDLMQCEKNQNLSPLRGVGHQNKVKANRISLASPEDSGQAQNSTADSRLTLSYQNIPNCTYMDEPESQNLYKTEYNDDEPDRGSRSLPTTPMHNSSPATKVVVHQRLESLCSSTGDSGFNSPRSSVSRGHNNNNMTFDLLNDKQNVISDLVLKRHSLGRIIDNNENAQDLNKMTKSPSNNSMKSTSSENTVKSQVEKRKQENGASSKAGHLNRPKKFDIIETL